MHTLNRLRKPQTEAVSPNDLFIARGSNRRKRFVRLGIENFQPDQNHQTANHGTDSCKRFPNAGEALPCGWAEEQDLLDWQMCCLTKTDNP